MQCVGCGRKPHEINEYREYAGSDDPAVCAAWVKENEGTYNARTDTFACTMCYIRMGTPSSPRGWRAPARRPYRSTLPVTDFILGVRRSLLPKIV